MKKKIMTAVMAVAIGTVLLSGHIFGIYDVKAETSRTMESANVKHTGESARKKTAALEIVSFDVPGMTCATCPYTVNKVLQKIDGVTEVKSSFETMSATVTFDPAKTSIETMLKALKNQGYPSSVAKGECGTNETMEC